jgi:Ca-activated chloride channel family protein
MVENLNSDDRVAIVTYAGSAGLALPSTSCKNKAAITTALDNLSAGGSTAGGQGINLAYQIAKKHCIRNGINRVILATDGDFNVGLNNDDELIELITEKAKSGVFITVLGLGSGNLNDSMLEKISGRGNGTYAYLDTLSEAKKVLVHDLTQSITTVAKDVKLQVEFNPAHVKAYRLLGYDNRRLEDSDFNDDKKDAVEIGNGHQVTAFYEVVPVGTPMDEGNLLPLRYREVETGTEQAGQFTDELMTVHLRYKKPASSKSKLLTYRIANTSTPFTGSTEDFRFATSVAAFGLWLQRSEYAPRLNKTQILSWAKAGKGKDDFGYREEFIDLVGAAKRS